MEEIRSNTHVCTNTQPNIHVSRFGRREEKTATPWSQEELRENGTGIPDPQNIDGTLVVRLSAKTFAQWLAIDSTSMTVRSKLVSSIRY